MQNPFLNSLLGEMRNFDDLLSAAGAVELGNSLGKESWTRAWLEEQGVLREIDSNLAMIAESGFFLLEKFMEFMGED